MTGALDVVEYAFDLESPAVSTRPLPASGPSGAPNLRGRKRWQLRETQHRGRLAHSGLPPLVAHVLENRGVASTGEAQVFLGGKPVSLCDPSGLPGFLPALQIMRQAVREKRLVSVYGDFDVDGITATTILTQTLRDLGGAVLPYIPNREREGYGLNLRAIDSLADRGVEVLVTCDCGTTALPEIEHARALGMEVVVVDHHVPPELLPEASALVNPKLPVEDEYPEYASAGVAYRLAEALYDAEHRDFPDDRYVELAAMATIADMVPLVGENRELVKRGLAALSRSQRPGLQALIQVSGLSAKNVTSEAIAFGLAPRINATGRLADARLALDLLLTEEEGTALALAETIDGLNKERQRITREAEAMAREMVEAQPDAPLILLGHESFHQGVIGLVASRLVEQFGKPAAVYQKGEVESRGSCRSIPVYDIVSGLRACDELFERYGGHKQAGGFTIRNEYLPALHERLVEHAAGELQGQELTPSLDIDAEWPLHSLRSQEIKWLGKLQPHGIGNPDPLLLSRGALVTDASRVGDGQHLRLKLRAGPVVWPAIAFRWEGEAPVPGQQVDAVFSLSADRYGTSDNGGALQLTVVDLAPAT